MAKKQAWVPDRFQDEAAAVVEGQLERGVIGELCRAITGRYSGPSRVARRYAPGLTTDSKLARRMPLWPLSAGCQMMRPSSFSVPDDFLPSVAVLAVSAT